MNSNHQRLSQCSSQQAFSPYYYPPSPFQKIATPLRARLPAQASPIALLTHHRSPLDKENEALSLNQSPIMTRFSTAQADLEKRKSPLNANKKMDPRNSHHHSYHKSEFIEPEQTAEPSEGACKNFEESLRSLTEKSPQAYFKNKQNTAKPKPQCNFKGILEAQQYEIKQKNEGRKPQGLLKKSSSFSQYSPKLFSSCFENSQRPRDRKKRELLCMNNDGNIAKYITIAREDDDERLHYCSKCTVLLVNQGFVLEEIESDSAERSQPEALMEVSNNVEACKDKLNSLINDLSMRKQVQLAKLANFYEELLGLVEKCKTDNQSQIRTAYEQKIEDYEAILSEVEDFSKKVQERQENAIEFNELHEQILRFNLGDPLLKKYNQDELNRLKESFEQSMQERFKLRLGAKGETEQAQQQGKQVIINRNNGLRFSFEKLLQDISSKKSKMQNIIASLEEEEEEDSEGHIHDNHQKTAFRDLFPESEESCHINSSLNSPTFKNF